MKDADDQVEQASQTEGEAKKEETQGEEMDLAKRGNMNKAGRPRKLDDAAKGKIIALMTVGFSVGEAAAHVGCHQSTIRRELERDEMFCAEVERSKKLAEMEPLSVIIRESRKSWRAAAWLMNWLRGRASRERTVDDHFAWMDGEKPIE